MVITGRHPRPAKRAFQRMNHQTILLAFAAVFGVALIFSIGRALRRLLRIHRRDRRLMQAHCPECDYPLRYNGTDFWCSECGHRFPK
jgi:hypothetical protein